MRAMSTPTPTRPGYGADEHGLICGYRFAAGAAPQPIDTLAGADTMPVSAGIDKPGHAHHALDGQVSESMLQS